MDKICDQIKAEIKTGYIAGVRSGTIPLDICMSRALSDIGEDVLFDVVFNGGHIFECKNCKRLFATSSARACYCLRFVDEKRRCRDVGPANTRNRDPITKAADYARRLHLSRREKEGKTDEACERYLAWLKYAKSQESLCREGVISIDEYMDLVGKNYTSDKL